MEGTLVLRKSLDYELLTNFSVDIRAQVSSSLHFNSMLHFKESNIKNKQTYSTQFFLFHYYSTSLTHFTLRKSEYLKVLLRKNFSFQMEKYDVVPKQSN